jgi:quercetin dioxygenase-like cupin family protein
MPVIRTTAGVVHEQHAVRFTAYANPSRGSRELCAWQLDVPANQPGVPHTIDKEEVFLVLDGEVQVVLDGQRHHLTAGDVAVAPPGTRLQVDTGEQAARLWVATSVGITAELPDGSRFTPPWTE